jgi:hypothetical protein
MGVGKSQTPDGLLLPETDKEKTGRASSAAKTKTTFWRGSSSTRK